LGAGSLSSSVPLLTERLVGFEISFGKHYAKCPFKASSSTGGQKWYGLECLSAGAIFRASSLDRKGEFKGGELKRACGLVQDKLGQRSQDPRTKQANIFSLANSSQLSKAVT
jgi:hypothetical protein